MQRFLVDTNIVSEAARDKPEPRVVQWLRDQPNSDLFLAAVSLGELIRGAERLPLGPRRQRLEHWIAHEVMQAYKGRIVAFDRAAATIWGRLLGAGDRAGQPRPILDAQIAATAISRGLVVATRNTADYAAMGAQVFDPWMGR